MKIILVHKKTLPNASNEVDSELSYHHKVPSVLDDLDWNDTTQMIHNMDSMPGMNLHSRQMARLHKQTICQCDISYQKKNLLCVHHIKVIHFILIQQRNFNRKHRIISENRHL